MNPPRATDRDYIDFLVGTPRRASACEAARVQPASPLAPAHDAFTRRVNLDRTGNWSISDQPIPAADTVVHVEGFGLVKAFRIVAPNGDTEHGITDDLAMDERIRVTYSQLVWSTEEYHRARKQFTEVDRCPEA